MNGVMGVTTAPPLLTTGYQAANWLVSRNEPLRNLLFQLGLMNPDYGVSLNELRSLVSAGDDNYRMMRDHLRRGTRAPKPTAIQRLYSTMSASEKARLRMLATLAPAPDDARTAGVEWSMDEVEMFCDADPGLVADYAAVLVSRYTGV